MPERNESLSVNILLNERLGLFGQTFFPPGIGDTRDQPLAIDPNKVEQVCPAVVYLAIYQKLERCPHYSKIVVYPD